MLAKNSSIQVSAITELNEFGNPKNVLYRVRQDGETIVGTWEEMYQMQQQLRNTLEAVAPPMYRESTEDFGSTLWLYDEIKRMVRLERYEEARILKEIRNIVIQDRLRKKRKAAERLSAQPQANKETTSARKQLSRAQV